MTARLLAYRCLIKSTKENSYSNLVLSSVLDQNSDLSAEERALFSRLYLGVVEKKISLDFILSRLSSIPLNKVSCEVLALLELGLFQILYMDRVPDHAAVFETVEIAKRHCKKASGYLNAVLRRALQEKDTLFSYLDLPGKKGLALRYSYPKWLVSLWQDAYGKECCESIMEAQNAPAALTLRVNTLKTDIEALEALLKKSEIPYHRSELCKNGIVLEKGMPLDQIPGNNEHLFFIQDAAAQRAIDRLEIKKGEKVLDLCAAPGGKSFAAAMDMDGEGNILSLELYPQRLLLIEDGAKKLGISCISTAVNDSTSIQKEWQGSFDKVICDVPCSGFGVIAKKPDIRHKDKEEKNSLPMLQLAILKAGSEALKAGGRILYSTCTLNPEENEKVVEAFLSENPDFIRIGKEETLFPKGGENDGFYSDLLEKKK